MEDFEAKVQKYGKIYKVAGPCKFFQAFKHPF